MASQVWADVNSLFSIHSNIRLKSSATDVCSHRVHLAENNAGSGLPTLAYGDYVVGQNSIHIGCNLLMWNCRSTLDGLVKIGRSEGVKVLYRGIDMNLLVGVPMVGQSCPYIVRKAFLISCYKPICRRPLVCITPQGPMQCGHFHGTPGSLCRLVIHSPLWECQTPLASILLE